MLAKGLKSYYPDVSTFGLHYTFKSLDENNVPARVDRSCVLRRHYTIANCMRQDFYNALVNSLDKGAQFPKDLCNSRDANVVNVTVKNYQLQHGLSRLLHRPASEQSKYYIKGPMGKGLGLHPQTTGTHIAFAAGTGILVFIDMIARIALGLLEAVPHTERLNKDFKLELYYSIRSSSDGICLELLLALQNYCTKMSNG